MTDTTAQTAREELEAKFTERAGQGMVDAKFYLMNMEEAAPEAVYRDVLSLYDALENKHATDLVFNDSNRC